MWVLFGVIHVLQLLASSSLNSLFFKDRDPTTVIQRECIYMTQLPTLVDTLEDVGWYGTLIILTTSTRTTSPTFSNNALTLYCSSCMHATHSPDLYQIPHLYLFFNICKIKKTGTNRYYPPKQTPNITYAQTSWLILRTWCLNPINYRRLLAA